MSKHPTDLVKFKTKSNKTGKYNIQKKKSILNY